jgi:FkbM family methyltransferase
VVRRLDARLGVVLDRIGSVERRLDGIEEALDAGRGGVVTLRDAMTVMSAELRNAKAVPMGDRILVGARHLSLAYLVERDDRLIGPRFIIDGEYEPGTTQFVMRTVTPTSVCIDVGANFGYYACLMARLAWQGRTLAFEPDPEVFALLRENIFINWSEHLVEPHNVAVGDRDTPITLYRRIGRSGNTGIIESTAEELEHTAEPPSEPFEIDCVTLDSLADSLARVDLVKIDVEGAETLVVAGMGELVRRHRPTIIMEWSPWQTERAGFTLQDLADRLAALGYQPNAIQLDGTLTPLTFGQLVEATYQNIVLSP